MTSSYAKYDCGYRFNTGYKITPVYPTPRLIAEYVARATELKPGRSCWSLKPDVGIFWPILTPTGRCYLHRNRTSLRWYPAWKGYTNTICCDFIKWSEDNVGYSSTKSLWTRRIRLVVIESTPGCAGASESRRASCSSIAGHAPILDWMTMDNYVYARGKSLPTSLKTQGSQSAYTFSNALMIGKYLPNLCKNVVTKR